MKYAMFICGPGGGAVFTVPPARDRAAVAGSIRLRPATDAATVRLRGDEVALTDGPAAASTGAVAGVDLVEVADLDEAIALARVLAELARIAPSPVVALNRAVAVGMADGPEAGSRSSPNWRPTADWPDTTCSPRREPNCYTASDAARKPKRPTRWLWNR